MSGRRTESTHPHLAEVIRLDGTRPRATASAAFPALGGLDPGDIKTVLEVHLAGRPVPRAVLEYALREMCRLIDEGTVASSPCDRR